MLLPAGYENSPIMTDTHREINITWKEMWRLPGNFGLLEGPSKRSTCLFTPEFIHQLQEKMTEDPAKGIWTLVRDIDFEISAINLALDENLHL